MASDMAMPRDPRPSKFLRELMAERDALLAEQERLRRENAALRAVDAVDAGAGRPSREAVHERILDRTEHKLKRELERERSIRKEIETYAAELAEKVALLGAELARLRAQLFGRRSERLDPDQALLDFGEDTPEPAPPPHVGEAPDDELDEVPKPKRKHPGRRPFPEHLERERKVIEPPESELCCEACGNAKGRFDEDVSSQLKWVPGRFVVVERVRGRWACRCGKGRVSQAPADEDQPLLRGGYDVSVMSHTCVSKYNDHIPNERQARIAARHGVEIPPGSLGLMQREAAELLKWVARAMQAEIRAGPVAAVDATGLLVRNPKKPKPRIGKVKLWIFGGRPGEVFVRIGRDQKATVPREELADFKGVIMADGESGLASLFGEDSDRERAACMAHARRKFFNARLEVPELVGPVMDSIKQLYKVEALADEADMTADERLALRQTIAKPVLIALLATLTEQQGRVRPKSAYGKALAYMLNWKDALQVYLSDGRVPIDNNRIERDMKHVVVGRKNWLFAGSFEGADAAAVHYSVVIACRELGIDPHEYYCDVLPTLHRRPVSEVAEQLTPRKWAARRAAQAAEQAKNQVVASSESAD